MKDMIHKQAVSLSFLTILALFVWFIGPLLAIANKMPLAHPDKRLYVITAFFLMWLLKYIFVDTAPQKPQARPTAISPETTKKIQVLQGRFRGALDFLKKTVIKKHKLDYRLSNLPWYLLIGPTGAGKTTLLANANINYILSKQFKRENVPSIPPSDGCDWWVTRDQVVVDVPGDYFTEKGKSEDKTQYSILWKAFLNLIYATSTQEKLGGIVLALNLPELMKKSDNKQKNGLINHVKKRITDLRAQFGAHIPIHIIITKCDLLPGFSEFFSETGSDELSQTWGITLPKLQPKDNLLDMLTHRFNVLIKRINKQLIWRLHQERNPNARPYIKDFPLHIERLKENVVTLIKALSIPDLQLCGVYLTSATQPAVEESAVRVTHTNTNGVTHQALQIMQAPPMPTRTYFVRQLILQGFLYSLDRLSDNTRQDSHWQRRAIYAMSIGAIVTAALLLGHDFQQSIKKAYSIQNDLARYQLYIQQDDQNGDRIVKALPLLVALQQAAQNSTHQLSQFKNILSFYSNRSQQTANMVYSQALQTIVIPEIKNDLERYLASASNKNPVPVYTALKAYLMLADPQTRDPHFIANTLNQTSSLSMNKQALAQLASHIDDAFKSNATTVELDQNLISDVRKQLNNLPSTELGLVILKNIDSNSADSMIRLGTNLGNPPVFVSKQVTNRIPNMFTADHFQKIVNEEISASAEEALKGNWVLGSITPSLNQPSAEALSTQLRDKYLSNYVDIWESQLANIQPFNPKNLLQVDEMLQNLTSNNSPLLQLLQTIKQNTSFPPINTESPKLQALNDLVTSPDGKQQIPLYTYFVSLRQLHVYLQNIVTASDSSQAAFSVAAERMQNPSQNPLTQIHQLAEQSPEPLKTWMNNIATQSFHFVLEDAGHYIENAWDTDVMPIYNEQIAHRYPFSPSSNQEVGLRQFTHFLGHRGVLAKFYQSYLKPFINDANPQWSWRTIDNQRIPLTNDVLINLQHAAQIQHVFFPNGDNKLNVAFSLQPVFLDTNIKSMTININGQQVTYTKKTPRVAHVFTWPGNDVIMHATTINVTTPKNRLVSNVNKGDWAWFKLVASATQNVNSRKELLLNIATEGHAAKYLLFTEGNLNPFLPMSMSRFELPQELLNG